MQFWTGNRPWAGLALPASPPMQSRPCLPPASQPCPPLPHPPLQTGKEGEFEREGYGAVPYKNWWDKGRLG